MRLFLPPPTHTSLFFPRSCFVFSSFSLRLHSSPSSVSTSYPPPLPPQVACFLSAFSVIPLPLPHCHCPAPLPCLASRHSLDHIPPAPPKRLLADRPTHLLPLSLLFSFAAGLSLLGVGAGGRSVFSLFFCGRALFPPPPPQDDESRARALLCLSSLFVFVVFLVKLCTCVWSRCVVVLTPFTRGALFFLSFSFFSFCRATTRLVWCAPASSFVCGYPVPRHGLGSSAAWRALHPLTHHTTTHSLPCMRARIHDRVV